jgi:nucleoid DNA-binding protein
MRELVRSIAGRTALNEEQAIAALDGIVDGLVEVLVRQGRVELNDLGSFELRTRPARRARNPRTGRRIRVPARSQVVFKPGRRLRTQLAALDQVRTDDSTPAARSAGTDRPWWKFW